MASRQQLVYTLGQGLYITLTNTCTLACVFCPKVRDGDWTIGGYNLRLESEPTLDAIWRCAREAGITSASEVVFTGFGESTRRFNMLVELIDRLRAAGARRVRLDTDGLANLREGRNVVPELAKAGLDAISVSVNAPDAATYARICPNRYGQAAWNASCEFVRLSTLEIAEVTASFVGLPDLSEPECRELARSLGARFRWRAYDRRESKPTGSS